MLISEITKSTSILLGFHTETLNYIASASQDSEIVESAKAAIDYAYTISHGGDDTVIPHKTTHVIHSQPAENSWGAMFVSWFVRAPEAVVDTRIEPQDNGLALLNAVADLHAKMPELVETNEFAVDDDRVIEVSEEVAGKLFTIATTGDVLPAGEAL